MLSSVLHDQIPHSMLFPNQPHFCLPPRVFDCVCFIHILTPGQDKLIVKATKYVFLSYSRIQRGYRCTLLMHINTLSLPMSPFLRTLLCSLPPALPILMSYLYPLLIPFQIPHMYLRLLHFDHFRFIPTTRVLTPSPRLTHLLWCLPPRRRSCHLPKIFPLSFGKVLALLITSSYL